MKKLTLLIIGLLILTGCENDKKDINENNNIIDLDVTNANYVCNIDSKNEDYNLIGKYAIYLDNENVSKINSVESIESDNANTLSYFESYYLSNYDKIANYSGYEYDIKQEDNKLIVNVTIDYQTFNTESYVIDFPDSAEIFDDQFKLKIDKLLDNYEKQGIKCEKK